MKVRWTLIVLLFLIVVPVALAERKVTSTKKVSHKSSITLNETTYTVRVSTKTDSIALLLGEEMYPMNAGDCLIYSKEVVCFRERQGNTTAIFDFYTLKPKIQFEMSDNDTVLWTSEKRKIEFDINNTGSADLDNFTFYQRVPSNLDVSEVRKCVFVNDTIILNDSVDEDDGHTCSYMVSFNTPGKAVIETHFEYFDRHDLKEIKVKDLTLEAVYPFNMTFSISPEALTLNQNITVYFNITNNITDSNMSIRRIELLDRSCCERQFPQGVRDTREGYVITRSRRIEFNESELFNVTFTTLEAGVLNFSLHLIYAYYRDDGSISKQDEFETIISRNITVDDPSIQVIWGLPNKTISHLDNVSISMQYMNLNKYMDISSMAVDFNASIPGITIPPIRIHEDDPEEIWFILPVTNVTQFTITANGTYQDEYNRNRQYRKNLTFIIGEPGELTIKKQKTERGLVITVSNGLAFDLQNVTLTEINDQGNGTVAFSINSSQELEALVIPLSGYGIITSNSTLNYSFAGQERLIEHTVAIDLGSPPPPPDNTTDLNLSDPPIPEETKEIMLMPILIWTAVAIIIIAGGIFGYRLFKNRPKKITESAVSEQPIDKTKPIFGEPKKKAEVDFTPKRKEPLTPHDSRKEDLLKRRIAIDREITKVLNTLDETPERIEEAHTLEERYLEIDQKIKEVEKKKFFK